MGKIIIAFFSFTLILLAIFLLKPANNAAVINHNDEPQIPLDINILPSTGKVDIKDYSKIIKSCPGPRLTVNYPPNLAQISQGDYKALDQFIFLAKIFDEFQIKVEGYTARTSEGDITPFAIELSFNRAKAVKDYLVKSGIDDTRIVIYGLGPANPLGSNNSEDGRTLNRRAEISFIVLE